MPAGLLAFLIALFASLMLTVPVRALALRVGMVDLPGPRKVHLRPIPLLGGLAMYGAVMLAVLFTFSGEAREQIVGILTGATVVAIVGILDDRGLLHHQIKLFLGMPLAACVLLVTGIHAQVFEFSAGWTSGLFSGRILTIFFVVGITASFSILDHMDGLCAGVAATASIFFALLAYLNGQTLVTTLAAAVLGASTGFLRWNFKPAKIFMGDGGAMFLGFLMATLGLKLRLEHANHVSAWLAPLLILGVTIFDTTLVTISRSRRGMLPFATPGKDHAAHRLANLGLGHRGAVVSLYLLGFLSGGAAVLVMLSAAARRGRGGAPRGRHCVWWSGLSRTCAVRTPGAEASNNLLNLLRNGDGFVSRVAKASRKFVHADGFAILTGLPSHRF